MSQVFTTEAEVRRKQENLTTDSHLMTLIKMEIG